MNFLAHSYLSCSDEDILIGNIITDFLSMKESLSFDDNVQQGIQLHRHIDKFTDKHPLSLELRKLLRPNHRKYSSVVVDLIWDRCLSENWNRYSGIELKMFTNQIYDVIKRNSTIFSTKLNDKLSNMIEADFLMAYSDEVKMAKSLAWMDKRAKYTSNFILAKEDYTANKEKINAWFISFFDDLIKETEIFCAC